LHLGVLVGGRDPRIADHPRMRVSLPVQLYLWRHS
jgi:hypothetical protein